MEKLVGTSKDIEVLDTYETNLKTLVVRPIRKKERKTWDELMSAHHYLGFRQLVGESIRYVALLDGKWVALLGWCSAAFKSGPRDRWIGWSDKQRLQRLRFIANNSRFLILPGIRIKNLASRILALNLKRLSSDWLKAYDHPIYLAETFVDHSRFAGTCYRAAGFVALGKTRGFGRNAGRYFVHGEEKTILIRPLRQNARQWLSAPFGGPALVDRKHKALVDLNRLAIDGTNGLLERLAMLEDPRMRREISHSQVLVLAVIVCACLSGARSYMDLGRWASALPQNLLRQLGCRLGETARRYVPPSESTLRRTMQSIDVGELCRVVAAWLTDQGFRAPATRAAENLQAFRARDRHPDGQVPATIDG
ncbi:DUF4338 domain-containing protein [Desulfallas sp. Bu1-1]|uniref:Druantia anti-phage system protein DruA n=1 Tax=Desulfallas sp. Bu1-1 TaxID=2787620 RepID=UPI00189CF52D|nr:Druantia anti-phage system protein DruA [Desulfallas sp. Bu1-1]MBF7083019.1 DUF4338 domain-containing protein [Desulfallas sp. Bu1-1]